MLKMFLLYLQLLFCLLSQVIRAGPIQRNTVEVRKPRSFKVNVHRQPAVQRLRRRSDGAAFIDYTGGAWVVPSIIGGQTFKLFIDTGSADLWLYGPDIPPSELGGQAQYNPSASTTFVNLTGETFDIGYGDGSGASGYAALESVSIGQSNVPNQAFGVANTIVGGAVGDTGYDGIMGLAFKYGNSIRPDQQATFMENLEQYVDQPIFTTNFHDDDSGTIEFGYVDTALYTGNLQTVSCDNTTDYPGSWTIDSVSFSSNGNSLGSDTMAIVVDTGGTTTTISHDPLYAYYANVPGAVDTNGDGSNWGVPCTASLPDLTFIFNDSGTSAAIPGASFFRNNGGNSCQSLLTIEAASPRGSVGDPFFLSQFVIFNQVDATISFAPQSGSTQ